MIVKVPRGPVRPLLEALDEVEIIDGFVKALEDSATYQMERLRSGDTIVEINGKAYEIYHDLDGSTWHLETLFMEHFPVLQRAGAFLSIWGSFEHHMIDLCSEVRAAAALRLQVSDLREKGISAARLYLHNVAGLEGEWASSHWRELPELQRLRNLFAHEGGRFAPDVTKYKKQRQYAIKSPHMEIVGSDLRLRATFLPFLLEAQLAFLVSLKDAVTTRFGTGA